MKHNLTQSLLKDGGRVQNGKYYCGALILTPLCKISLDRWYGVLNRDHHHQLAAPNHPKILLIGSLSSAAVLHLILILMRYHDLKMFLR